MPELVLDGQAGGEFLAGLFEFEYCAECGWDLDKHTAVGLYLGDYGTNWFALCDDPIPDDPKTFEAIYQARIDQQTKEA
jgi:hypothetical protein